MASTSASTTMTMIFFLLLLFTTTTSALVARTTIPPALDNRVVANVRARMLDFSKKSWELGTATEALFELDEADISVYGEDPFPPRRVLSTRSPIIGISKRVLATRPPKTLPLMEDGATGDPASMGIAVLLAGRALYNQTYASAASDQLTFLLSHAPRSLDGAISHRVDDVQLWNDFIYMGPPFIAYMGALSRNYTLLLEAKRQIGLYRQILRDEGTGLWKHIVLGSWEEPSLWGTGIGWTAAGAVRVLQTMLKSDFARALHPHVWELSGYIQELLNAIWKYQHPNGALSNHPTSNATHTFNDSSFTALLASATYRFAVQTGRYGHIGHADRAFAYVRSQIKADGTLQNVVNVTYWNEKGRYSPEGQAFVLLMHSARRDFIHWRDSGKPSLMTGI